MVGPLLTTHSKYCMSAVCCSGHHGQEIVGTVRFLYSALTFVQLSMTMHILHPCRRSPLRCCWRAC
jgi:hypothetical protein